MTLKHAVLELEADVDDDGSRELGIFHLKGNLEINQMGKIDHLLSREFGNLNAVVTSQLGSLKDKRTSFYLDFGNGVHSFEINFLGWEGASDQYTWGDPNEPVGVANATGSNAYHQKQCLMEYLRSGEYDSREERARLRYGEYSDGTYSEDGSNGVYDSHLHVTVKRFSLNRTSTEPVAFTGSIILEETQDLTGVVDIVTQGDY